MARDQTERPAAPPDHQVTGRDYPGEWARRIECHLDEGLRRPAFYGGLFGAFVLALVSFLVVRLVS
jgi:hypothetical protein